MMEQVVTVVVGVLLAMWVASGYQMPGVKGGAF